MVRPHLEEVVRLVREAAAALAPALGLQPYDALMDGFQRGMRAADVAPVFADYETFLRDALPQAEERQARQPGAAAPAGSVPGRGAGGAVPAPRRTAGPGFRPRTAGSLGASVLRRHADRRAHHHAL